MTTPLTARVNGRGSSFALLQTKLRPSTRRGALAASGPLPLRLGGGFSLVELMVGVVLGSAVLASLGGVLLLSDMRVSSRIQQTIDKNDALSRARQMISHEALKTSRIFTIEGVAFPAAPKHEDILKENPKDTKKPLCNGAVLTLQFGTGASAYKTCYYLMRASAIIDLEKPWKEGTCVLLRWGYPYKANGDLDVSAGPVDDVIADDLYTNTPGICPLVNPVAGITAAQNPLTRANKQNLNPLNGSIDVTLRVNSGSGFRASSFTIAPAAASDFLADVICKDGNWDGNGLCIDYSDDGIGHYRPAVVSGAQTLTGSKQENIVYFDADFSKYTLSACSPAASNCVRVNNLITLYNMQLLVFRDRQVRPPWPSS